MSSPPTALRMASSSFRRATRVGARTSIAPRSVGTLLLTEAALACAKEDEARNLIVDPYAVPVDERNGHVAPKALREAIRAAGPTTRRDLGKQAMGLAPHSGPTAMAEVDHVSLRRLRRAFVAERVAQFRDQVARRLAGELTEDEFKPLRLMNGALSAASRLHAAGRHSLRHAERRGSCASSPTSPATTTSGYGHFTTRQNIQFNWPKLEDVPDILAELAEVEMHAIQTSRQLHPQHHRRSFRRRRRRRDRRSAALMPRSSGSGRPSTRNSPSCRASSRSR